jgi:two-component system cell cycle sensor histidine kinase PleC
MVAELIYGISWASLSYLSVEAGGADPAPHMVAFAALIVILSLRTMLAGSLAPIFYSGTLPITLGILISFVMLGEPMYYAMAGVAACAQVYAFFVARRLTANTLAMFELRVEKDSLIAELEQSKSISDEARRRAEAANIAKSRFLATMSHELRTPLNAVLGFSEVMKAEILGPHSVPTYKEYSEDIHRSGQHLLNLINEVLDLSRIEAGRYELHEEAISLADVVDDCMRLTELRLRERGIALNEQIEEDMPDLWADERAVRQICLNLLSNSIKFTPNGGEITVKVGWTEGGGQYLSVSDTGPGISEEELPQILTSFGQGSLAQKTAEQGAGLGLPIVQGLIKLHGGKFQIASKLREGTQVTVTFPRTRILTAQPVGALANSAA